MGSIKDPVTVRSEVGGLEASLQVTSGPYFLSELLGVTVTLTNHRNKSVFLQGSDAPLNSCNGALSLSKTGGSEPHYAFINSQVVISCPFFQTKLDPGKTFIVHGYEPLTESGEVTLTPGARFLTVTKDSYGSEVISPGHSLLDSHWPTVQIDVVAKIPADRTLSLHQKGSQITIDAPTPIRSDLVYYDVATCTKNGSTVSSVSTQWKQVSTPILQRPECSGSMHWTYAVSAPGYAVVSGVLVS